MNNKLKTLAGLKFALGYLVVANNDSKSDEFPDGVYHTHVKALQEACSVYESKIYAGSTKNLIKKINESFNLPVMSEEINRNTCIYIVIDMLGYAFARFEELYGKDMTKYAISMKIADGVMNHLSDKVVLELTDDEQAKACFINDAILEIMEA